MLKNASFHVTHRVRQVKTKSRKQWTAVFYNLNRFFPILRTFGGSFSAVWTATIARKDASCRGFRDLQDMHSFAPLKPQNFAKFCKILTFFFAIFAIHHLKNKFHDEFFDEILPNFDEILTNCNEI